jgi:hypothetical protein
MAGEPQVIAVDQYGRVFPVDPKRPRASLLGQLGHKHADKIYRDKKDGLAVHVGYVIAGHWLSLYQEVAK